MFAIRDEGYHNLQIMGHLPLPESSVSVLSYAWGMFVCLVFMRNPNSSKLFDVSFYPLTHKILSPTLSPHTLKLRGML